VRRIDAAGLGTNLPQAVYDRCEALFLASEMLRLQNIRERSAAVEEIEREAERCQMAGDCPLTNACLHRFPQPVQIGPAARRRADNVRYLHPQPRRAGRTFVAMAMPEESDDYETGLLDDAGNLVIRQTHSRAQLDMREAGSMALLMAYWEELASEGWPPRFSRLNPWRLRDFGLLGRVNVDDVSPAEPAHFTIELHGAGRTIDKGVNYTGMQLGQYDVEIFARSLLLDFGAVKASGRPAYHQLIVRNSLSRICYTRLLLPFSSNGKTTDRVLTCFRSQPPPLEL
jgi:hypothetical protein